MQCLKSLSKKLFAKSGRMPSRKSNYITPDVNEELATAETRASATAGFFVFIQAGMIKG